MGEPELLILAPVDDHVVYREFVHAFVEAGCWFPFGDDYELPDSLPEELDAYLCIVADPRRQEELEAGESGKRLLAWRQGGGFLFYPNLKTQGGGSTGDIGARHWGQRAIVTAGLTQRHPQMVARLQGMDEDDLVAHWRAAAPDELRQYTMLNNPFGDPTGYTVFRAAEGAASFFGDEQAMDPVWAFLEEHAERYPEDRWSNGGRFLVKLAEHTGNRHYIDLVTGSHAVPDFWQYQGVFLNQDLVVPPGADYQKPPPKVIANAWTWPEVAARLGDTYPLLTQVTGDPRWLDTALTHILSAHRWLFDPTVSCWRHVGRPSGPDPASSLWGRGNAWFMFALRGLLEDMPTGHPQRGQVIAALAAGLEGILKFQQDDGLWLNVLDGEDNSRACASATSRYVQIYATAYAEGWLRDERIPPMVERAWLGLKTKIWRRYQIAKCVGTSYSLTRQVYLARPHHTFRPSRSSLLQSWIARERMRASC